MHKMIEKFEKDIPQEIFNEIFKVSSIEVSLNFQSLNKSMQSFFKPKTIDILLEKQSSTSMIQQDELLYRWVSSINDDDIEKKKKWIEKYIEINQEKERPDSVMIAYIYLKHLFPENQNYQAFVSFFSESFSFGHLICMLEIFFKYQKDKKCMDLWNSAFFHDYYFFEEDELSFLFFKILSYTRELEEYDRKIILDLTEKLTDALDSSGGMNDTNINLLTIALSSLGRKLNSHPDLLNISIDILIKWLLRNNDWIILESISKSLAKLIKFLPNEKANEVLEHLLTKIKLKEAEDDDLTDIEVLSNLTHLFSDEQNKRFVDIILSKIKNNGYWLCKDHIETILTYGTEIQIQKLAEELIRIDPILYNKNAKFYLEEIKKVFFEKMGITKSLSFLTKTSKNPELKTLIPVQIFEKIKIITLPEKEFLKLIQQIENLPEDSKYMLFLNISFISKYLSIFKLNALLFLLKNNSENTAYSRNFKFACGEIFKKIISDTSNSTRLNFLDLLFEAANSPSIYISSGGLLGLSSLFLALDNEKTLRTINIFLEKANNPEVYIDVKQYALIGICNFWEKIKKDHYSSVVDLFLQNFYQKDLELLKIAVKGLSDILSYVKPIASKELMEKITDGFIYNLNRDKTTIKQKDTLTIKSEFIIDSLEFIKILSMHGLQKCAPTLTSEESTNSLKSFI